MRLLSRLPLERGSAWEEEQDGDGDVETFVRDETSEVEGALVRADERSQEFVVDLLRALFKIQNVRSAQCTDDRRERSIPGLAERGAAGE